MKKEKKFLVASVVAVVLLLVVIVISGIIFSNKETQLEDLDLQNAKLNETIEKRDSLVDELGNAFNEIEKSLTFIKEKRGQLELASGEGVGPRRQVIIDDIKLMNRMLEESSKKIEELNRNLRSSGMEINSFNTRIVQLTKHVEEQSDSIQQLKNELAVRGNKIAEMDQQMTQLENKISEKNDIIEKTIQSIREKESELNKAFFTKGSFKELEQNDVVTRDGGFLWFGRTKILKDNFNEDNFTKIDKRETDTIPLFSDKVEIISEHSESSYSLIYEDDQIAYLKIENPKEFWKVSNYVVVETK